MNELFKKTFALIILTILFVYISSKRITSNEAIFTYDNINDLNNLSLNKNGNLGTLNNLAPTKIYTIPLKYCDPIQIKNILNELYPNLAFSIDKQARKIILDTDKNSINHIYKIIRRIDKKPAQIKVEIKIIEINYDSFHQYENIFSTLTSGLQINYDFKKNQVTPIRDLTSQLTLLTSTGYAKILATPSLATLDNNKASIKIGDKIPYLTTILTEHYQSNQIQHLDTGIELEILPKIIAKDLVFVDISAKIDTIKLWKELGSAHYPLLANRKINTKVYIKNKETLVIAGLLDEEEKENNNNIPIISEIPIIGELFKNTTIQEVKTDILFLITPEILKQTKQEKPVDFQIGTKKALE